MWPQGGVGRIAEELVAGLQEHGGAIEYKANVREILTEGDGPDMRATGVRLADGRVFRRGALAPACDGRGKLLNAHGCRLRMPSVM